MDRCFPLVCIIVLFSIACGGGDSPTEPTDVPNNADTSIPPDVQPVDNGTNGKDTQTSSILGTPCTGNADCKSDEPGWCINGKNGNVCTQACITECPDGWTCKQVDLGGGDLNFACVPRHVTLCRPCKSNTDCTKDGYEPLAAGPSRKPSPVRLQHTPTILVYFLYPQFFLLEKRLKPPCTTSTGLRKSL